MALFGSGEEVSSVDEKDARVRWWKIFSMEKIRTQEMVRWLYQGEQSEGLPLPTG